MLNIVIAFLHDFPPGILVSVTDAIAAIIVAILAIIWAIFLIIGGVVGVLAAIKPPQIGGGEESPQLTTSRTQELQLSVTNTGDEPAAETSKSGA